MTTLENINDLPFFDVPLPPQDDIEIRLLEQPEQPHRSTSLALQSADILNEIFEHLSDELEDQDLNAVPEVKIIREALLAAALTCRELCEPAISAMWRVHSSLTPLLKLLPSFIQVGDKYILEEVKAENWIIFERRSRHVQVLHLRHDPGVISPFTWHRLQQLRPSPILPALRKICIFDDFDASSSILPFLSLWFSVRMIELRDNSVTNQEFYRSFSASIPAQAPLITRFDIRSRSVPLNLLFLPSLLALQHLELDVAQGDLSVSFMMGLGRLERLKRLILKMGSYVPPMTRHEDHSTLDSQFLAFTLLMQKHKLFAHLEYFCLSGHPDSTLIVLAYIHPPRLEHLVLNQTNNTSSQAIRRTNATIISLAHVQERLKTLIFNSSNNNFIAIQTFQGFNYLETLIISGGAVSLPDADLTAMSARLKQLRTLVLPEFCYNGSPSLTFLWTTSMLPVRLECLKCSLMDISQLNNLTYDPHLELPDLPKTSVSKTIAHHALRRLSIASHFGSLSDAHVNQLSKLVHCAFPKLDIVEGYGCNAEAEAWDRVNIFRATLRELHEDLEQDYKTKE